MNAELRLNVEAAQASNTRRVYQSAWRAFCAWAGRPGPDLIPAPPDMVAEYLSALGKTRSHATLRCHAAAIANMHKEAGVEPPTAAPIVRKALAGHANRKGVAADQASPLDVEAFAAVLATARKPRVTRGGMMETEAQAARRGVQDIAMIGLMRDAMLRRSEAAALLWANLAPMPDGSARVMVQRSKTDQKGVGAWLWVSPVVAGALGELREIVKPEPRAALVGLKGRGICRRIAAACRQAGLEGHFSGHSPRIGMAQDLARSGLSLPTIMQAGRWRAPEMVSTYIRQITAADGAVARWYQGRADAA